MKTLDKYILKSFLKPFFATFLIVLFVLVMQALWLAFEDIAGKGIDLIFILKFLYYTALIVTPQALPIGVLLSSIMALGSISENYEFAAIKSAGVSLQRLIRPLIIFTVIMSVVNFLFLNNVYPYAMLKQKNLYINIKKHKPALALIPGGFNTEIPGYHIKFSEKFGENNDLLKDVKIYDLTEGKGNKKIITAKNGQIINKEGSKHMTLKLFDGYFFEDHISFSSELRMPSSNAKFEEYSIIIDISAFSDDIKETENVKNLYNMLSLKDLDSVVSKYNLDYKEYIRSKAKDFQANAGSKGLVKDTTTQKTTTKLNPNILANFDKGAQLRIISSALAINKTGLNIFKSKKDNLKYKRLLVNKYETEYYNRIAFSLSCLILFFIGAPLGSIIRKGGFGLPMILAISIYVLYFFTNTFGRNLAEDSTITSLLGSWISAIIMVPFAFFLTRRATKDMGLFNIDVFLQPVTKFFKKLTSKKTAT
ncbi:MAG: YjgP/YjgQ family permease [Flavobacteriaceae bacterium]|nr:YjgP/YjgQ family permease [Flavobacteriaceae bacterium]